MEKIYIKYADDLEEAMHFRRYYEATRILDAIEKETRLDTLREVLPIETEGCISIVSNDMRNRMINKAKELWDIDLTNLNK